MTSLKTPAFFVVSVVSMTLLASSPTHAGGDAVGAMPQPGVGKVIVLEGTAYERGCTHGKTLQDQIGASIKLWKADLTKQYGLNADVFIKRFVKATDYVTAIKRWTPELLDEIRGMADGAGTDFDTMLVFQLTDEYWVHGRAIARERCSSLGFSRSVSRPTLVAQNLDIECFWDGSQVVLHVKPGGGQPEAFVLSHAGCVGVNGLNDRAVAVCCNTLTQLRNCRDGLPVACVVRGVLAQKTESEARTFLKTVKHASGQNYILGGPDEAASYECSSGRVARYHPPGVEGMVWHTNHPLANDDYTDAYREALKRRPAGAPLGNSAVRLQCLERRLGGAKDPDLALVKETLCSRDSADHPVCRSKAKGDAFTFASTIMMLGKEPELHWTAGPPDAAAFQVLKFKPSTR